MIEQTLTVSRVEHGTVWLVAEEKPACAGCNGKCGSQIFSKLFGSNKKALPIECKESVQVGQKMTLALDDSKVVENALWVYLLPLVMAFIATFTSHLILGASEPWQILSAVIGGLVGFKFAKQRTKALRHDIKVIKIYPISLPLTQIDGDCAK
ncbi:MULTISPECIES: SoxR reducing system RseC family protein [unclassified Pseudoalteromonas]|uniref:SoxR reducing system RseC family protein n=1 Tax=unclassified Pseudoalteromonas TaxID=194690 RepID=UPI0020977E4F|nr:SoxR reducing system RseC family protein [Pseudoalteromonas sp. XMcav2-N]MCO7187051.1 SoxR reducing system RseC family protein [Pseudoalteromonas sp. XMcav2-N]